MTARAARAGLLGAAVSLAACGGSAATGGADAVPARLAVDGLGKRRCEYAVEPGSTPSFERLARAGTRGDIALWGRDMGPADSVELSIRYDEEGQLTWARAMESTIPPERVAALENLVLASLAESGPGDWGVRVRVVAGRIAATEPSVICPAGRSAAGSLIIPPPVTRRGLMELYSIRGRRFLARVSLDEKGRVMDVRLNRSSGFTSVDQYIMDMVRASRFEPKLHDGFGVATLYEFPIRFTRR